MKAIVDLVSLAWFGLVIWGFWLMLRRRNRQRRAGIVLLAIGAVWMLTEMLAVPVRLLAALERPWVEMVVATPAAADAIVYLGGPVSAPGVGPLGFDLNDGADRVLTAVDLARQEPARPLLLGGSGWGNPSRPLTAELIIAWTQRWKALPDREITALPPSGNTHDEALHTAEVAKQRGWKTVCLVTSAWHMRRARAVFEKTGLKVVPAPCDFKGVTWLTTDRHLHLVPSTDSFVFFNMWAKEVLGYVVYQMRGWI